MSKKGSGLGARLAAAPVGGDAVAAGMRAALGGSGERGGADVAAINIRLPRALHTRLRRIAFEEGTSINAMLVRAAEKMFPGR